MDKYDNCAARVMYANRVYDQPIHAHMVKMVGRIQYPIKHLKNYPELVDRLLKEEVESLRTEEGPLTSTPEGVDTSPKCKRSLLKHYRQPTPERPGMEFLDQYAKRDDAQEYEDMMEEREDREAWFAEGKFRGYLNDTFCMPDDDEDTTCGTPVRMQAPISNTFTPQKAFPELDNAEYDIVQPHYPTHAIKRMVVVVT